MCVRFPVSGPKRLVELLEGQRARVAQRLARTLRRMHWCGFSMRDLKTANILLFEREGRLEFALTDLDDVRFYANGVGERRRIANLARLYFDVVWLKGARRKELLRFLRDYLGTPDRATLARYVSGVMQLVKAKRATFVPKGIFAEVRAPK